MRPRPILNAIAFVLNAAVFLVGVARLQGRLAPPDVVYVGLLLVAPTISAATMALGYRRRLDREVMATARAATALLNGLVLAFVAWLATHLDPDTFAEEALWLVLLFAAPFANAAALLLRSQTLPE